MQIVDKFMQTEEYMQEVFEKTLFFFHHTAGGHRPDWVIDGWESDDRIDPKTGKKTPYRVATAFVIGGLSTSSREADYDGVIYRAFDEKFWSHHLGTKLPKNQALNKAAIGVEICNYGPLRFSNGTYFNYVNKPVPANMVVKLDKPFRGYQFYHRYTDKQLQACVDLMAYLKPRFPKIPMKTPLTSVDGFKMDDDAQKGVPGVYTHINVLFNEKFDCFPQPEFIQMMNLISKL